MKNSTVERDVIFLILRQQGRIEDKLQKIANRYVCVPEKKLNYIAVNVFVTNSMNSRRLYYITLSIFF